jgi:hypothetical protein
MNFNNEPKYEASLWPIHREKIGIINLLLIILIISILVLLIILFTPNLLNLYFLRLEKPQNYINPDLVMVPVILLALFAFVFFIRIKKRKRFVIGSLYEKNEMIEFARRIESSSTDFDERLVDLLKKGTLQYKDLKYLKRTLKKIDSI